MSAVRPGRCGHATAASQSRARHVGPLQLLLRGHVVRHLQTLDVHARVAVNVAGIRVDAVPCVELIAHGLLHDLLHGVLAEAGGAGVDGLRVAGDGRVDGAVAVRVLKHGRTLPQFAVTVRGENEVRGGGDGAGGALGVRLRRMRLAVLKR